MPVTRDPVAAATANLLTVLSYLRSTGAPEEVEEALLTVLDQLAGWCSPQSKLVANLNTTYEYAWGNNEERQRLKGRRCRVVSSGALGSVLIEFLDNGERVITSRRALRDPKLHKQEALF